MSTIVYIAGSKGGTGKTTTAHLACLGAILRGEPAAYVLTDPLRKVRGEGRPYNVIDGRDESKLSEIIVSARAVLNGWFVIDGGGNRPKFDAEVAPEAGIVLLPFRASEEDLDTAAQDMARIPNSIALPSAWTTNAKAQKTAAYLIEGLEQAFPGRVIADPVPFINSVSDLLVRTLGSPSTPVRSAARKVFDLIEETAKAKGLIAEEGDSNKDAADGSAAT